MLSDINDKQGTEDGYWSQVDIDIDLFNGAVKKLNPQSLIRWGLSTIVPQFTLEIFNQRDDANMTFSVRLPANFNDNESQIYQTRQLDIEYWANI